MRIVLIGFMGSGKSSIAKLLHQKLHWPLNDTDILIESKVGKKIPEIFSTEGEEKFREYETQILKDLCDEDPLILATGGGIIEKEINHQLLKHNALVIYLKTTPENVLKFTANDKNRPLLQGDDRLAFITERMARRESSYLKLGEYQIETYRQTIEDSAQEIINYLKLKPPFPVC